MSVDANRAIHEIAQAQAGVFVLIDDGRPNQDLKDQLDIFLDRVRQPRTNDQTVLATT